MASHSLLNYQKMERMMRLPPLGDRKPSVLLAEMLEFCPEGESSTAVFAFLFLQRLPREIRVLLSEDGPANMPRLAISSSPRREARDPDDWATGNRQISAAGSHAVGCRKEGVSSHARRGHNSPLFQPIE